VAGRETGVAANGYPTFITAEHAGQPNFTATVTISTQPFVDEQHVLRSLPGLYDLGNAVGSQLDTDGLWIGLSRYVQAEIAVGFFSWDTPGLGWEQGYWQGQYTPSSGLVALDDDTYRAALMAKAQANKWDGTCGTLSALVPSALLPDSTVAILDNQNMSMTMTITGLAPPPLVAALLVGGYIPFVPAGVQLTYAVVPTVGTTGLPFFLPQELPH
jgi:Protein of unknown function (DUF2612)